MAESVVVGIAFIEEAQAELSKRRPSCTEERARHCIQVGTDVQSPDVVRLWRAVLARIVEGWAWS